MSVRSPSPSQFRPKTGIDQSVLENNKALLAEVDRRKFLRGSLSLGALAMLTGCDVTSQDTVQAALRAVSSFNDRVQALMFRPNHLAPTYREAQVVKPPRFNAYYGVEDVDRVDGVTWKLELPMRPDGFYARTAPTRVRTTPCEAHSLRSSVISAGSTFW